MQSDSPRAVEDRRLRWHCRRGLLELDLVLNRFLDTRLAALTEEQRKDFVELLTLPDTELWAVVSGKDPCPDVRLEPIVAIVRGS